MTDYQYKASGMEWLGEVPEHWIKDKLYRLCDRMGSGGTPKSSNQNYYRGDIPWIQSGDLNDGYVKNTEKRINEEAVQKSSAKIFPKDTLLVAMYGASIGKLGIMKMNAATNQACCALQLSNKVNKKFVYYFLLSSRNYLIGQAYGGGQNNISQETLKQFYFYYPPLPEQKAIANYLDTACQKIDRVIAKKEQQIEKIEKIRKNRIDEVVRFGLEDNPDFDSTNVNYIPKIKKGWNLDRFKDVAILRKEKTGKKTDEKNYIELEDIEQGTGRLLGKKDTTEVESDVTLFRYGDVLFGKLRPYLEKYHHADFDGKCTGEILAFKPLRIKGKFLMYIIASKWFIDLCNSMSYGAKMPRVNWPTQLSQVKLPLPSEEEQQEIVSYLDNLSNKVFKSIKNIQGQINTLHKYKKSLIHECVTGKKRVFEKAIGRSKSEQVA